MLTQCLGLEWPTTAEVGTLVATTDFVTVTGFDLSFDSDSLWLLALLMERFS